MVNLLVHLILGDEVADVVGGLTELPLVHACSVRGQSVGGVPVSVSPSAVYQWRKALRLYMETNWSRILLNRVCTEVEFARKVPDSFRPGQFTALQTCGDRPYSLPTCGRDVADCCLDIVWYPVDEVLAVLVLHPGHVVLHLPGGDSPPEHGGHGEEPAAGEVTGGHEVVRAEHLTHELLETAGDTFVLSHMPGVQRGKPGQEEVEPREGDHVDRQLPQVSIELAGEPEARRQAGHGERDQVVEVTVGRSGDLQRPEAEVIQSLVINHEGLVRALQ